MPDMFFYGFLTCLFSGYSFYMTDISGNYKAELGYLFMSLAIDFLGGISKLKNMNTVVCISKNI